MSASFQDDPEFNDAVPKPGPGFTLVKILLGVATIAIVVALFLPAVRTAGPAVRRSQCTHNLKQIAMALLNYERDHKALPPPYTTDASGKPLHSWRTLILPYLDQQSVYENLDLSKPWNDPVNATASSNMPAVFICPEAVKRTNKTAYLAVVGLDRFLATGRPRRIEEITDDLAKTIAVIEAGEEDAVPWMAPLDADPDTAMKLVVKAKLHHAGGTNAALADGSVRFLKADTPDPVRRALLSISGNDEDAIKDW